MAATQACQSLAPPHINVLIADDNATNRKLLRRVLESEGHTVLEAENGIAALKFLEQRQVDAVISDILMPGMDGFRLCFEIRRNPNLRKMPFIVYTASYTSASDEKLAMQFGADRFIRKPASADSIVKTLYEVVESAQDRCQIEVKIPEEAGVMRAYSQVLVSKLEQTIVNLSASNKTLAERTSLAEFAMAASTVLSQSTNLKEMLLHCCDAMVKHLDAALARIWTLNEQENLLELQASSGIDTEIDAGYGRVPVGQFNIGLIASERKAYVTHTVIGDPRVHDQEWARREGMVAFAGYPLLIGDQLVGVMVIFTRNHLSQNALEVMGSVAQSIAVGIQRQFAERELRQSEERFRDLAENINEIFFVAEPGAGPVRYVSPAYEAITGQKRAALYQNPHAWLESIHPDDRARVEQAFRDNFESLDQEYRILRPDGELRWLRSRFFPVKDERGEIARVVGIATDITEQKQAEATVSQNLDRIRALHEIDIAINSTLDLNSVLQVLLEKIDLFIPYPSVTTLRLLNKETGQFEFLACRNIDADEWKSEFIVGSRGRARRVLETQAPVTVRNLAADPSTHNASFYSRHNLISYASVSLVVRDEALGVLNLYTKEEHEFTGQEMEFLTTLAGQAAVAIRNARLYEETERRRREAEELARVARSFTETLDMKVVGERIVTSVRELFCVQGAVVRLCQTDGSLRRLASSGEVFSQTSAGDAVPSGVGLTSRAITVGRPVWSSDTLNDPEIILTEEMRDYQIRVGNRSMIAVPLRAHEKLIGALTLSDRTGRTYADREVALLQTFADQAALALENARLYEQTERQLKRIEALREIEKAITSTLDLSTILNVLMEKIDVFFTYPAAATVRLFDKGTGLLEPAAARNMEIGEWIAEMRGVQHDEKSYGRLVIEEQSPLVIANLQTDSRTRHPHFYREHGLISYAGVPLIAKDEALGVLGIYTKEEHSFSKEEIELLMVLAGQAAIAIHNARLYEHTQRQLKRIQGVSEINNAIASSLSLKNVLDVLLEKTELFCSMAIACGVRLFDETTGKMVPLASRHIPFEEWRQEVSSAKGRLTKRLIETKKPMAILNMHADSRTSMNNFARRHGLISYLGVPLIVRDEFIGNLVIYTKEEHDFSAEEIDFFTNLGSQAAIAIHNAQLYEDARAREAQLNDRNRMLSALHAVGAATSQSLDIEKILKSAIERITEIFGFDAIQIHTYDPKPDELVLRASFETDPARFTAARSFKKGQGIVGRVAESGEALIFDDVQSDPRYRQLSRSKTSGQYGYHFFAVLPIKGRRETFGTLACVGNDVRKLSAAETQMLEAITGQIAVALENSTLYQNVSEKVDELQRVNTTLQDTNRMLSALHAVAAAANQSLDLNRVLQAAIGKITEIFQFDATRIHLFDAGSDRLVRRASYEKHPERFTSTTSFKLGEGIIGKVAETEKALVFEDVETNPLYQQLSKSKVTDKFRDRFFAAFPIRSKSGTLGTLACLAHEPRKLSSAEVQLIEAITDQVAVAIENARLFEKNELSKQELATTNRFLEQSLNKLGSLYTAMTPLALAESLGEMVNGIIERLIEATGADAALIRIWDRNASDCPVIGQRGYSQEFIEELRPERTEGAIHWVVEHGEPIIAPDIASDRRLRGKRQMAMGFQSCTILPLRVHRDIRGVIQLSSRKQGYFDDEQKDHLMAVARQMSISLENRELFYNLQTSRNELERANKVKDEFLSVMSHELRTPLSIVIGYSGMLREEKLGPLTKDQAQGLEVIQRNSKELFTMIDSIMDATKIDAGSMVAEKDTVSPLELLDEIKIAYDFPIGKDIRFEWNFSEALPSIWTDLRKLRQILTNLINNAIKFTEEGSVVVSAQLKNDEAASDYRHWIEFRVQDSGVGIPAEECEKIFERFHQVDSSETRSFEGVGLGLYIVKSFTEMLGGRVSVASEVGRGSTFTVCLPIHTAS